MSDLAKYRAAKDEYLTNDRSSPLYGHDDFAGLTYYPDNIELRVKALVTRPQAAESVTMATSSGDERVYVVYGTAHFEISGVQVSLALFSTPDQPDGPRLFVPFRDATSGKQTYGAGRYLEAAVDDDPEWVVLDFNYAYHPYCAYVEGYSCPFPPVSNWLRLPVEAGERLPPALADDQPDVEPSDRPEGGPA